MKLSQIQESAAMEMIEANPDVVDQDTYMSGAYIRSLVKQLTTSTSSSSSSAASSSSSSSSPPPTPPKNSQKSRTKAAAPHKKQVRRRLHTTRPYQERLLNMAEARKEIVTALKFHRASMKHQQHQHQQQQLGPPSPPPLQVGAKAELPSFYVAPPPPALLLPNQTLGLSLNLDAACLYTNNINNNNNVARSPLPSPLSVHSDHREIMTVVVEDRDQQGLGLGSEGSRAVGDQEMEEIKSIGEMHEMEWNDTVNLATSAWWFNFLHKTESEEEFDTSTRVDPHQFIEHAVEFPLLWEDGKDPVSSLDANFELPCMKIEDIEGLDEEWLY